ncbi:MAG TPA: 6-phosphogluconolactonase [Bryobacteraceae bacterium]|jgi:6-phosphogluconolactonase
MNRHIAADTAGAAESCARRMLEIINVAIESSGSASIAVSGGSTPKLMFAAMAKSPIPWEKVHLFFVDERVVPMTSNDSNYKLAFDNLISPAAFPAANVHRVHGELEPEQAAVRYRDDITEFFQLKPGAMPRFDAIHLGMGEEGHTASLFPGDPNIKDRTGLTAAVYAPKLPNWRVTTLPGVLLAASHTLMLVAGADKNPVLKQVASGDYDPSVRPVQLIAREGSNVEWFLDQAAAAGI